MSRKFRVLLYRSPEAPDGALEKAEEVAEFLFAHPAKEHAKTEVAEGRARKAVVINPDGTVILTWPR